MTTHIRAGLRAARTLLSLLEENSAEELEAAESILGGEKELTNILQLLRKYKEYEEEPLSNERLRDIVRKEILDLSLPLKELVSLVNDFLGGEEVRSTSRATPESVLDQAFLLLEARSNAPSELVEALLLLLRHAAHLAGAEQEAKLSSLLRDLAIQALTENRIFFPSLHTLAQLRVGWRPGEPLPYKLQESRRNVASRLLKDLEQAKVPMRERPRIMADLIKEGLRGPADAEIAAMRRMRPKKAHGE